MLCTNRTQFTMPVLAHKSTKKASFPIKVIASDSSDYESFDFSSSSSNIFNDDQNYLPKNSSSEEYLSQTYQNLANLNNTINSSLNELNQETIREDIKKTVIDWCIRVCNEMSLNKETLFFGVHLFQLIIRYKKIHKGHIQLFAATALWIASKFEEINTPSVSDFSTVCGGIYSFQEFYACERYYLKHLHFNIAQPTIDFYIHAAIGEKQISTIFLSAIELLSMVSLFLEDKGKPDITASAILRVAAIATGEFGALWNSFPIDENEVKLVTPLLIDELKRQRDNEKYVLSKRYAVSFSIFDCL